MDAAQGNLGFRPLYRQVRDALVRRIVDRTWAPGDPLPSENELAAELGVSQGTVRKALDEMAAENLVVRRQGRGTFVAVHDEKRILFQFFKLVPDEGDAAFPESVVLGIDEGAPDEAERRKLKLAEKARRVVRIRRLRSLGDAPMLVETIVVPASLFPGLARRDIPNNLYGLYADQFGITVARAEETLKAIAAGADEARDLGCAPGTPLLLIDRTAIAIDGAIVEWRVSKCLTTGHHYKSDLR